MAKLILCPFHKEGTPSLALYGDGYKCFGCGKYGPLSDITGVELGDLNQLPEPAEDLESAYKYIDSLPTRAIRGLTFPADEDGYFITWADKSFYKKRLFGASKAKYRNPRGHKQPVLWVRSEGNQSLVIVEGEINALSVARAVGEVDVLSPGSASQFSLKGQRASLKSILLYDTVYILADKDGPGAEACIELMTALNGKVKNLKAHLMERDANDLLVGGGCEGLRKEILGILGSDLEESP